MQLSAFYKDFHIFSKKKKNQIQMNIFWFMAFKDINLDFDELVFFFVMIFRPNNY